MDFGGYPLESGIETRRLTKACGRGSLRPYAYAPVAKTYIVQA